MNTQSSRHLEHLETKVDWMYRAQLDMQASLRRIIELLSEQTELLEILVGPQRKAAAEFERTRKT